jgi:MFS transporter, ACS family, D-galactonate transporter
VIGIAFGMTGSFVGPLLYIGVVALVGAFAYSVVVGDIHRLDMEMG